MIGVFLPGQPPDFFSEYIPVWAMYPPLWWFSSLLLIAAIITKKLKKEKPYPFSGVVILFFIQVFFGFHPLTPYPLILVLAFTAFYHLYILRKGKGSNTPVDSDAA